MKLLPMAATDPWGEVIDLLTAQLAELAQEDPDPGILDHLQKRLQALTPALAAPPPPGLAAAWAEAAREAARLTAAVGEAAALRREDLTARQRQEVQRVRNLSAYGAPPAPDDARFIDRRG